jgi:ADP-ribosyl-[dinitrogen reductase] hydrolase
MNSRDRFRGCLLGLACGDAVGTTLEFKPRGTFEPITDLVGGGPFGLKPGEWTDDTSMALCLATSLVECNGFDPLDQMERYSRWQTEGYMSSNGVCFDIGNTVADALNRFRTSREPYSGSTHPHTAGNGSLMRLAPVPMFYCSDLDSVARFCGESSRTTHGAREAVDACRWFGTVLAKTLRGESKETVLEGTFGLDLAPSILTIAAGSYRIRTREEIKGSGYVVKSLEAALWCFFHTADYRAAILAAANLGDDADTTAAICGQIAGAYYGAGSIPASWLEQLAMRKDITQIADRLHAVGSRRDQATTPQIGRART